MGSGSDLVYRVVLGWRFGPVPNNKDIYQAELPLDTASELLVFKWLKRCIFPSN